MVSQPAATFSLTAGQTQQMGKTEVIHSSRLRFLGWFLPIFVLLALSLAFNWEEWTQLDAGTSWCLGLFAVIILSMFILLPTRNYIRLTPHGLVIQYVIGRRHYPWSDVRNFRSERYELPILPTGLGWLFIAHRVVFDLADNSPHKSRVTRLLYYDGTMAAWFELPADELAKKLNSWQHRYSGKQRM